MAHRFKVIKRSVWAENEEEYIEGMSHSGWELVSVISTGDSNLRYYFRQPSDTNGRRNQIGVVTPELMGGNLTEH